MKLLTKLRDREVSSTVMKKNNRHSRQVHRQGIHHFFQLLTDDWIWFSSLFPSYSGPRSLLGYEIQHSHTEQAYQRWRREYQKLQYLKRQHWIKIKKTEKGLLIALTDKGKIEKRRRDANHRSKLSSGYVCLVMFDIPELAKKGRDQFRFFLKQLGFSLVQKSVWQSQYDLAEDILQFIKEMHVEKWTAVYTAKKKS
jgi:hypothetical protein